MRGDLYLVIGRVEIKRSRKRRERLVRSGGGGLGVCGCLGRGRVEIFHM